MTAAFETVQRQPKLADQVAEAIAGQIAQGRLHVGEKLPGTPATALQYHGAILAAVESGDPAAARRAMQEHLDEAETTLTSAREAARA